MDVSSNILDKSAMEALRELEVQVPVLTERVGRLNGQLNRCEDTIGGVSVDVKDIQVSMSSIQQDIALMARDYENAERLCPLRDAAIGIPAMESDINDLRDKIQDTGNDVAEMRGNMKWYAGILTALTAGITGLVNVVAARGGP